jgi:hypothetical protein
MLADLDLAPEVRVCAEGDWYVFLDLERDRYWAISRMQDKERIESELRRQGLASKGRPKRATAYLWFSAIIARLPDWLIFVEAAFWARRIERSGDLACAFAWISKQKTAMLKKRALPQSAAAFAAALERADALRLWIPHRYICLFDALCHCRFLLQRGFDIDLVFGVRGRPFAAHCWIEAQGQVIDAGQEDCASFAIIARA